MLLRKLGKLIRRGGKLLRITPGVPCECCGGTPGSCGCSTTSPWYRTTCVGEKLLAMQAVFTRENLNLDQRFRRTYSVATNGCAILNEQDEGLVSSGYYNLSGYSPSFTLTPLNAGYQNELCGLTFTGRRQRGTWNSDLTARPFRYIFGQRGATGLIDADLFDHSRGLNPFANAVSGPYSETSSLSVRVNSVGTEGVRIVASWIETGFSFTFGAYLGSTARFHIDSYQRTLFSADRYLTNAEFCDLEEITLTGANGGSCVISRYAGTLPTAYSSCADCYLVTFRREVVNRTGCGTRQGYQSIALRFARTSPTSTTWQCVTSGYVGGFSPGVATWGATAVETATGQRWFGTVGRSDDGECPGSVYYLDNECRITAVSAVTCTQGVAGPCEEFEDCYQFGEGTTQTITRSGRLYLYFNDNNFADNEIGLTMTVAVYVDGVLTWTVNVPNDSTGGIEVGSVSAGQDITTVRTAGAFNFGSSPASRTDADAQYIVGGGDPGVVTANETFICEGLLTWTLVGKVISP